MTLSNALGTLGPAERGQCELFCLRPTPLPLLKQYADLRSVAFSQPKRGLREKLPSPREQFKPICTFTA